MRSCTVIGRASGSVSNDSALPPAYTRVCENAGRNLATGSSSWKQPSSYSISAATVVIGLVIEYMR